MANMGVISNLGLGSEGALNYDIIDKLKKIDEDSTIKPIDNKIATDNKKEVALSGLTTLLATLKGSASSLSHDDLYTKVSTDISGSSANVVVNDGASSQTITLNVDNIATNDVKESKSFTSTDSHFTNDTDTLKFELEDGSNFSIDVDSNTTISQLAQQINDNSDGKITASILNVGGDDPYKLIVKSTQTGSDNAITISSTGGGSAADDLSLSTVGDGAKDAHFTFNGISITRSSNKIDDLVGGVSIELVDSGKTTIDISQDINSIKEGVNSFISSYNSLIDNLNENTKYDTKTKQAGIFQNVSQIRDIKSKIDNIVFDFDKKGHSLSDFGITLNATGHLELDESKFNNVAKNNMETLKEFFKGSESLDTSNGLFNKLNNELKSIFMNKNSQIKLYQNFLKDDIENLTKRKEMQSKRLDEKYDVMAKKFAAYDKIIAKFSAQSESLQMQIQSFINNK